MIAIIGGFVKEKEEEEEIPLAQDGLDEGGREGHGG